jgi:hypothetical protein
MLFPTALTRRNKKRSRTGKNKNKNKGTKSI